MSSITVAAHASERRPSAFVLLPGLAITASIALIAYLASHNISLLKNYQMIMAIILGALVHNVIGMPVVAHEGVAFALRRILRFSIVLLGLQITAQQAIEVGAAGIALIAVGLLATLLATILMGRILGVPYGLSLLIGVGTAICGASAIISAKAAVQGKDEDAAQPDSLGAISLAVLDRHDYHPGTGALGQYARAAMASRSHSFRGTPP